MSSAQRRFTTTVRVLVVDDDDGVRETLAQVLIMEGYDVVTAMDGQFALELYECGERFDVVMCDCRMPRLTGHAFFAGVRQICGTNLPTLISMTGDEVGIEGADVLLTKPLSLNMILEALTKVLRR